MSDEKKIRIVILIIFIFTMFCYANILMENNNNKEPQENIQPKEKQDQINKDQLNKLQSLMKQNLISKENIDELYQFPGHNKQ